MDTREAARELIARGWSVVPVPACRKEPNRKGWPDLRIRDDEVPAHFDSDSNIGILTGAPSGGLGDVDLDCSEAVRLAPAFLPPTAMRHGRPGNPESHRWYRITDTIPPTATFKDVDKESTNLLELRTDGHQTLVPPSRHPDGEDYAWSGPLEPFEISAATLVPAVEKLASAALLVRYWPRSKGSRHDIAKALAGMLLRGGWTSDATERFIFDVAFVAGDEESSDRARTAVSTATRLASQRPVTGAPTLGSLLGEPVVLRLREWLRIRAVSSDPQSTWRPPLSLDEPRVPEFPVDVMPEWLAEFVAAEATATQTPLALAGGLVLAVCSVAVSGRLIVRPRRGWDEPVNIYVVIVLDPGNRKSAVFAHATEPILKFESGEARRLRPSIRDASVRRRIVEGRLREVERRAAKASADTRQDLEREALTLTEELESIVVPVEPRCFADDVTPERLAGLLYEHDGRFAVLSAEGGVFEIISGRYSPNSTPNLDVFLKGHAGDALRVDRIGRPPEVIDHPAITLGLAVQHDVLRGLVTKQGFRGRGLLARFLYALPESLVGRRLIAAPPVREIVKTRYADHVGALLNRFARESHRRVVNLTPDAERTLIEFETRLEPQLGRRGALFGVTDWASKHAGAIARIAAILHVADRIDEIEPWMSPLDDQTLKNAMPLGEFFLAHALAAFAQMGADPAVENARHVLDWIRRKGLTSASERDIFQGVKGAGRFQTMVEFRSALDLLESHEYVRPRLADHRQGPGRPPSATYDINPYLWTNSEDIENSEEAIQTRIEDSSSPYGDTSHAPDDSKRAPQYSHNPQNSLSTDPPPSPLDGDEVVL